MFFEMTADNVEEDADAVIADILVEGSVVGEVTLLVDGKRLKTWGGDARAWASEDLLTFMDDAEEEDDDFHRADQIHEIVGAAQHAWKKS